jgi:hypothetical protein
LHGWHVLTSPAPDALEYVPAAQGVHVVVLRPAIGLKVPGGQVWHCDVPEAGCSWPAWQSEQSVPPLEAMNDPAGQDVHVLELPLGWIVPAAHA